MVHTLSTVADLLTSTKLDALTRRIIDELRPLSLVQRATVIRAILVDDDRVGGNGATAPRRLPPRFAAMG